MKRFIAKAGVALACIALSGSAFAGNKDRSGQAGAPELLINPWGISAGVFGANTSLVRGIEAMKGNIAGLAYAKGTEVGVAYNAYLKGANVNVFNLGFGQSFGDAGVLGINIQSMNFGEITISDYDHPQGGIGTYKPSFFNLQVGYAKEFSRAIHAGVGFTYVSEQITDARASGAAFEAGVQYTTGARDNFHFGVTLRNVGTNMRFTGEGFAFDSETPTSGNGTYQVRRNTPSDKFEMPTYLNLGASYDFYLGEKSLKSLDETPKNRLTAMLAFTSNSFNNDYIAVGLEYGYKEMFMLRAGYRYEKDIMSADKSTTFYKGVAFGATVNTGLSMGSTRLALDYAFRPTRRPDNGVHNIALRFTLDQKKDKSSAE